MRAGPRSLRHFFQLFAAFALASLAPAAFAQTNASSTGQAEASGEPPAGDIGLRSVFASAAISFIALDGEDATWSLVGAGVAVDTSASGVTIAQVEHSTRPGLANTRAALRHEEQLSASTSAHIQISASTGDPLREEWGIAAGAARRISPALQLTVEARAARYAAPDPVLGKRRFTGIAVTPGIVVSPGGTPLELTAQAIILRGEDRQWQAGGAVRALYYTGDRDFLIAGAARYPETELGTVRQLSSAYAGIRQELGERIGLRVTAEYTRLDKAWRGATLSVGLDRRF